MNRRGKSSISLSGKPLARLLAAFGMAAAVCMALLWFLTQDAAAELCDNGVDDDGDGLADQLDPDCPGYSGFTQLRQVRIRGAKVSAGDTLRGFPMFFQHTDADFKHSSQGGLMQNASGYDFEFCLMDGSLLDFELQHYDGTAGTLLAWVKIPALVPGQDLPLKLLSSKSGVAADPSSAQTWSANYGGRWHLDENPAGASPQMRDETPNVRHAVSNGGIPASAWGSGIIHRALPRRLERLLPAQRQQPDHGK